MNVSRGVATIAAVASDGTDAPSHCCYCNQLINSDDCLQCSQCHDYVHTKCLRHVSTPGDLFGDVFFEFTCAKCMQLQIEVPSPSSCSSVSNSGLLVREKFVRQRLPWFMVVTLTLYNLSIKSKGLSRQGYFHWRSHIANFIEKNWDYLFEVGTRRRKNWIGSISSNLSHYSPEFFQSGQEVFNEAGWWKLTYSNQTPKFIYKLYEQLSQRRQQLRNDRRLLQDAKNDQAIPVLEVQESKRIRCNNSDDERLSIDSCSRTIPYMGRKPKIAKQLNIVDDDVSRNLPTQQHEPEPEPEPESEPEQPLNTVQSSLMDFLAENLGGDDLSMFHHLPNIAPEALVDGGGDKNDFLSLMDAGSHENVNFFDVPEMKCESRDLSNYDLKENTGQEQAVEGKLKSYYAKTENEKLKLQDNAVLDTLESSNEDTEDDDEDEDEYQPRIVQVTNFQQMSTPHVIVDTLRNGQRIKEEVHSEADETEGEQEAEKSVAALVPCRKSLFTKQPHRKWPWLVQEKTEETQQEQAVIQEEAVINPNKSLVMMSEYEERQLLRKMRKIFSLEHKYELQIPAYIRRFYRKLCVREWNREHGKPLFDLDKYVNRLEDHKYGTGGQQSNSNIIDRYQLLSLTAPNARKSFYARIAGSFHHELFQSPYSQRVLHPFIYRNKQCFPPWLKLMCEVEHAVTGNIPQRAPVDFCYVRPNHIAAVNALLQATFWPGIDMSECLSYPDFSVVALYKKLVVGCGFLVPDVGFNEAYISFMAVRPAWQRSGIATFMLYHLIQTCMSKDITLHVSATNPAVVLYQKFGFKIEEVILDFYDKYLPIDSKHSRNALFLRLMR